MFFFFFTKVKALKRKTTVKILAPVSAKKNVRAGFALKAKYLDHLGLFCENKRPDDLSREVNDCRRSVH